MVVLLNQVIGGVKILSGGEKIVVELLRRWKKFYDIEVIMPQKGLELIKDKEGLEVKYHTLPLTFLDRGNQYWRHRFLIFFIWLAHTARSCAKISKMRIADNIIYSAGDFFPNIIPAFLKKAMDKKIIWIVSVFHIIDSPMKKRKGQKFLDSLASWLFQNCSFRLMRGRANLILVLNSYVKSQLAKNGFDEQKIQVLGAGIDLKYIDSVAGGEVKYAACFMARLSPTKGIIDLPRIWVEVIKERPDSRLLIIGGGTENEESKMRSLIAQYKMERQIEMAGVVKAGKEKYGLMKSCRLFIFPSYEEGFAISILEAMACGLPVVAWDLPEYQAIYNDNLLTVPTGNTGLFAKMVVNLLANEKMMQAGADKGYAFSRNYDWDVLAQKAHQMINGVTTSLKDNK
jgi:glycosyltransferase involved in cell wall biosynthesis